MATETRVKVDVKTPEVDVLAGVSIDRINGRLISTFQPAVKVMDGTTQKRNALGQPVHAPADAPAYGLVTDLATPESVERMVALESGALARIVAATLTAAGNKFTEQDVVDITTQLLHSGQGIDAAMTNEAEALRADMLARWDARMAEHKADPDTVAAPTLEELRAEFGTRIDQGPDNAGPFV